ncbi:MAG TPA: hypothetical protein VFW46_04500, partial [Stellaceae bacterium]|nr:hypothetical protein [Stellaceae bacterium]
MNISFREGWLTWPGGSARAACGRAGISAEKREGDGASPAGTFPLVRAFYRPDRIAAPRASLPLTALSPGHGWVDDPADPAYNRLVTLPYPAGHEALWREDATYDVLVVIGYNIDPIVP